MHRSYPRSGTYVLVPLRCPVDMKTKLLLTLLASLTLVSAVAAASAFGHA